MANAEFPENKNTAAGFAVREVRPGEAVCHSERSEESTPSAHQDMDSSLRSE